MRSFPILNDSIVGDDPLFQDISFMSIKSKGSHGEQR